MDTFNYPRILPRDVFIWRALPRELNHHVVQPPEGFADTLEALSSLPTLPPDMRNKVALHADWQSLPELRPTGCAFLDQVADYIHFVGITDARFIAAMCGIATADANGAFKALTGMSIRRWSTEYTRLMVADLQKRTTLTLVQIADVLHFPTAHALVMFLHHRRKKGGT